MRKADFTVCFFCVENEKTDRTQRLIIVTDEEERTIYKAGLTIEVVPAYKFLLGLM